MPHSTKQPGIQIVPLAHGKDKGGVDFGAEVFGVDLNNFTDHEFKTIEKALHMHKVLIFKEQPEMLRPSQQYKLTKAFDPESSGQFAHAGTESVLVRHKGVDILGIPGRISIPSQPQVHILGRGQVPPDHYGLPDDFQVKGVYSKNFHAEPHISDEDAKAGVSHFYQWHFDAALYDIPPPRVGCLLAVRTPKGPDCTIRWEDDEGTSMKVGPGATAYVAGSRALELVPEDLKSIVEHSRILYAPKPFKWMSKAHSTHLGHSLVTEGLEIPIEELDFDEDKLKRYPMIWNNPMTGEKSLQIHGQAAWKLYLKSSADSEEKVVDDLAEVRAFMDRLMRPAIQPENIYAHHHTEQDVVLWYNRALWHSVTEFPDSYGPRIMHQCNVAASDDPK
ncbi:alpha-ketoglutarate dependent xanthine dioxygenase [Microdochium trichocladiopsis]|uniref:Alpha-ketoglutarate dependent xanthine dioxygenase n=1 Tax=Microdochium trichocladiopsis TaxID=1682393 RepID=A0A9P9BNB9_9PEZI|nr:alpha-ketoglutarate dependent xanthine dioxygenase [Microdochium trichocladiopsis]KAH7020728.1 alpha-ketoglutarate dependent xanthine dioxygenase [Microdochium trichocladiopsis]